MQYPKSIISFNPKGIQKKIIHFHKQKDLQMKVNFVKSLEFWKQIPMKSISDMDTATGEFTQLCHFPPITAL